MAHRLLGAPPAILCATPAYLQRRGTPGGPDDLRAHDLLTPEAAERRISDASSRGAARRDPLSPRLAVNDPAVLHAATAAGLGIGVLPEFLCRQGLATGRLKLLLPDWQRRRSCRPVCGVPCHAGRRYARPAFRGFPGRQRRAGAGADGSESRGQKGY